MHVQPGILSPIPRLARYVLYRLKPGSDAAPALRALAATTDGDRLVVGIGQTLVSALGSGIAGLRLAPARFGRGVAMPSTPVELWCWLRGDDRGHLLHESRRVSALIESAFELVTVIDAFQYDASRDLSGYEDGTENPRDEDAVAAAIVSGPAGLDGSSFVAVQQWVHDLDRFQAMPVEARDRVIGRRIADNEEIDDAPESAHVKRTAQESFDPPAFVLRRSMPWADACSEGLVFVAFGRSFDAFEVLSGRMLGHEDGIVDALFRFTRPVSGAYFWCPPLRDGRLDLSVLGI